MAIAWQDASRTIQRYQITPTLAIADGTLGCTGWCWSFLRDLEKGGVNRAVLGLWFPWTEIPETSQKNDISLTHSLTNSRTLNVSCHTGHSLFPFDKQVIWKRMFGLASPLIE